MASYTILFLHPAVFTMTMTLEALESEVLRLAPADRAHLLDRVVASLDTDAERDAAWDAVAARRDAEMDSDASTVVALDEALTRLRADLR